MNHVLIIIWAVIMLLGVLSAAQAETNMNLTLDSGTPALASLLPDATMNWDADQTGEFRLAETGENILATGQFTATFLLKLLLGVGVIFLIGSKC